MMYFYCIKNYEEMVIYYSETEYTKEEFLMLVKLGYENTIKKLYNFTPYDLEASAVIFYEPAFNVWVEENTDLKILKNDLEINLNEDKIENNSMVYLEMMENAQC